MAKERSLIIVESPNKIATIRDLLKGTEYKDIIITASVGHITRIQDGGAYWNTGIDVANDFEPTYVINADKKKRENLAQIKEYIKKIDKVYIASDDDNEGHVIAYSLKRFLKIPTSKCYRLTFHEITQPALLKAFEKSMPLNDEKALVLALPGIVRAIVDKLIGYALSSATRKLAQCPSFGRCQSPAEKFLVDREKEITNFKPETYYELYLNFKKNKTEFKAKCVGTTTEELKDKVMDKTTLDKLVSKCTGDYKIESITTKDSISNPKPPFTTSSFQQEVSSKLGISVKYAQSCAQKLYEGISVNGEHKALVTYLRTDSITISPDFVVELEKYVMENYGDKYFNKVKDYKASKDAQDAHECFRAIDLTMTPEKLASYITDEKLIKVYRIIYQRTLQLAFKPAITAETTYTIDNNGVKFTMTSKELKFDGYKKVYGYEKAGNELIKETFVKGEVLEDTALDLQTKQTKPPARYTEGTFIGLLKKTGIGRPSTFDRILETIKERGYCIEKENSLYPTDLGVALVECAEKYFPTYIDPNYTSEMNEGIDKIQEGKLSKHDFLQPFYDKLKETVDKLDSTVKSNPSTNVTDKKCPKCGSPLVKRFSKKTGSYFLGCSGYPNCNYLENIGGSTPKWKSNSKGKWNKWKKKS